MTRRPLSEAELQIHSRHILLPGIGGTGVRRWGDSTVTLHGPAQVVSPAALLLERAGVAVVRAESSWAGAEVSGQARLLLRVEGDALVVEAAGDGALPPFTAHEALAPATCWMASSWIAARLLLELALPTPTRPPMSPIRFGPHGPSTP